MNPNEQQAPPAGVAGSVWPGGHRIGNFELQSALPRGGTAVVYRAWDHSLSRPVAIKEYLPAALSLRDADGTVRPAGPDTAEAFELGLYGFIDEARLLARCDHPSLVRVLDLIEAHGTAYRVMPWYSGRTLRDVRRKMTGPIGEPALRLLLDNLLGALEAFHQIGGVHRGVSPSQTLLLDVNRVLLMGPGASNRVHRAGMSGAIAPPSEPGFAPPEQGPQADGQPQGPWTDFYALAALARFCITGVPPSAAGLDAPEPLAAAVDRMFARQQPSVQYDSTLLEALDTALARDVTRRPQSAAQFRERLGHAPPQPPARPPVQQPPSFTVVDEATAKHIQRVVDALPGPTDPAPWEGSNDIPTLQADPQDRAAPASAQAAPLRRKHGMLWAGLAIGVAAAVGFGAMTLLPSLQTRGSDPSPVVAVQAPAAPSPATLPAATSAQSTSPQATEPLAPTPTPTPAPAPKAEQPVAGTAPVVTAAPPPVDSKSTVATVLADAPPKPAPTPVTAAMPPPKGPAADTPARTAATSPRQECGARTEFSLYRCMQLQCSLPKWQRHPQCERLRATDTVE